MKYRSNLLILLILVLGGILRLWWPAEIPLTHDELSALFRTDFDSFRTLIDQGVRPDGHPAGIQVFLYFWVRLVGMNAFLIKIPFILMGIASIYLMYRLGLAWFNRSVGLIGATYMASLQYPLIYSQMARPYISGLFFSLGMVLYWTYLMKRKEGSGWRHAAVFVLFTVFCAYNHHFSLMLAAVVGIAGLFLVPRSRLWMYVSSCLLAILLYLPHLGILLGQMKMKGIGGWLGKPDPDFILQYLAYVFHFSSWVLLTIGLILAFGLWYHRRMRFRILTRRYYLLSIAFFLIPFLIAYIYSLKVDPVLQYSVLIFYFPFLIFIFIGPLPELRMKHQAIMIILLAAINLFSLLFERQHYRLFYAEPHQQAYEYTELMQEKDLDLVSLVDMPPKIKEHYFGSTCLEGRVGNLKNFTGRIAFREYLEGLESPYMSLAYVALTPADAVYLALEFYPHLLWKFDTHGGGFYILSKSPTDPQETVYYRRFKQELPEGPSQGFHPEVEWGPAFTMPLTAMVDHRNDFIDISLTVHAEDTLKESLLVFSLESGGENSYWSSIDLEEFRPGQQVEFPAWFSIKLADIRQDYPDVLCKIYIWNRGKDTFSISDVNIRCRRGNRVLYGLIEPL